MKKEITPGAEEIEIEEKEIIANVEEDIIEQVPPTDISTDKDFEETVKKRNEQATEAKEILEPVEEEIEEKNSFNSWLVGGGLIVAVALIGYKFINADNEPKEEIVATAQTNLNDTNEPKQGFNNDFMR